MTTDKKMNLPWVAESLGPIAGKPQFQKNFYAREVRAVGQALEARHVFSLNLELKGGPLRRTRQGNRCRLRAVVVFRFHSRLRLGSWIGFHRRPSPVDLRDRPTHRRTSKNLIQRAARIGARRPESRSLRLGTETTRGRLVSGLSARNDPYRNIG